MTAVEHLRAFARPLGVQILLENLEKNEVAEPQNLMEILTVGHFDDIGMCLDLGHAHIGEGIPATIDVMGPRIRSVHVHDNAGEKDSHLWPGDGTIAWPETMRALEPWPNRRQPCWRFIPRWRIRRARWSIAISGRGNFWIERLTELAQGHRYSWQNGCDCLWR